jgi:hypothetical protein
MWLIGCALAATVFDLIRLNIYPYALVFEPRILTDTEFEPNTFWVLTPQIDSVDT